MLLEMSLESAVFIIGIMAIRRIFLKYLPKWIFPVLWAAVSCRLLVPKVFTGRGTGCLPFAESLKQRAFFCFPGIRYYLPFLWAAGMVTAAIYFADAHVRFVRFYREALPCGNRTAIQWSRSHTLRRRLRILELDRAFMPFTYGILRPVIVLPKAMDVFNRQQTELALMHEYVHIRRFDALLKCLLTLCVCIHWFNPLVYIAFSLANRDIELACDESVLRKSGVGLRSEYAFMLINFKALGSGLSPLCSAFAKKAGEERILAVMKTKAASRASRCVSALYAGLLCACILLSARMPPIRQEARLDIPAADEVRLYGYPVNENGETYGPELPDEASTGSMPDLILAENQDGVKGYVRESEASGKDYVGESGASGDESGHIPQTPGEAGSFASPADVNLYLQDGKTIVGKMRLASPR